MNWFDEQLRTRKEKDDLVFSESMESIAGAVMGKRLRRALDNRAIANSAIEEILHFYSFKMPREELPFGIDSIEDQLDYRLRPFGIMRRTVTLDRDWYRHAAGPMLGTLKESGAAVALIPGRLTGYSFLDLNSGKRIRLNRRSRELLDREAICFYPALPMKRLRIFDLLKFMASQLSASDLILYFAAMAVATLTGMLAPVFTKWLFGPVLNSASTRVLAALACFMICFSISQLCFQAIRTLINARITIKLNVAVQAAVMNRIMSLPPAFFKRHSPGELSRRSEYICELCSTIVDTIGTTAVSSLFSLLYLGQIFVYAPALVVPSLTITILTLLVSVIATLWQMRITKERMLLEAGTSGMLHSMISGIRKIKLAGAEKRMFSRWAKHYSEEAKLAYNPPLFLTIHETVNLAISLIGAIVLYYCAIKSNISTANFYAFTTSYAMISAAFNELSGITAIAANIKPTFELARPILEAKPEPSHTKEIITDPDGSVTMSHVTFRYQEDAPPVLDDLSLRIRAGEYVAIVGPTGCGKSTLMRLLLGFETPQKGSVYYGKKDLAGLDLKSLRRRIGVVMQDSSLFSGSIYSNIVISAPQLTPEQAWEAAEIASVAEDIREMPMGMHTYISESQGGISGGQKQRLMIARAVAPKPKLLMFDEATSALDNITQKKVSEAIDRLQCTRIIIAHRLSTIRHCDRILVMDQGKITAEGTYDELIAENRFFADLVARQHPDIPLGGEGEPCK